MNAKTISSYLAKLITFVIVLQGLCRFKDVAREGARELLPVASLGGEPRVAILPAGIQPVYCRNNRTVPFSFLIFQFYYYVVI